MLPSQSKSSISLSIFLSQSKSLNYEASSILWLYYSTVSCTWSWSNILIHFLKMGLWFTTSSILWLYYSTVSCTWSWSNILIHLIYINIYIQKYSSIKIDKKLLMMDLTIVRKYLIYLAYKPYVRLTCGPYKLEPTYLSRICQPYTRISPPMFFCPFFFFFL